MLYVTGTLTTTSMNCIINNIKGCILLICTALQFGCNESKKTTIEGEWIIENSEVTPFDLPDNCNGINVGDTIVFKENDFVVKKKPAEDCNRFYFTLTDSILKVKVSDMAFDLKIHQKEEDKIVISSNLLPKSMMINWKEEYLDYKQNGFKITLSRK